jgi:hypothetical protein
MITGVKENVEAAAQVDEPVARVVGAVRGSVKKPGHVVLMGHGEQAGGVP